jgi:dienelactone hydrolase
MYRRFDAARRKRSFQDSSDLRRERVYFKIPPHFFAAPRHPSANRRSARITLPYTSRAAARRIRAQPTAPGEREATTVHALRIALLFAFVVGCNADETDPESSGGGAGTRGGASSGGSSGSGAAGNGGTAGTNGGGTAGSGSGGTAGAGRGGAAGSSAGVAGSAGALAGSGAAAGAGGSSAGGSSSGPDALEALRAYLAIERASRPPLGEQPFASVALGAEDALTARAMLWDDHVDLVRTERQAESDAKSIRIGDKTLRYDFTVFGAKPATGRSLFLSLHGGGEADASVNDEQWENQKVLYEPEEGIYLAPRAPTNTWNLWHEAHIDGLFTRLIENLIALEDVDPNRVYVMGYSAGGDGVYQLAPRMADSWAAAAMMAGHPNDAKPDSLRNIGFTIHVGAEDSAYDRNLIAGEWNDLLDTLESADPDGYAHEVEVHAGKGHWMDLEDAVAVPWMAEFTRDPLPRRVVWLQDDVPHERFYWLAVPAEEAETATKVVAECDAQTITLETSGIRHLKIRLSDALVDLDQPVSVSQGGAVLFSGPVIRTIGTLAVTLAERGDPALVFPAELTVEAR